MKDNMTEADNKAQKKKKKKKSKWIKKRHTVLTKLVTPVFFVWAKLAYRVEINRLKKKDSRQFLILSNHQTEFDQFFIGLTFPQAVYYVASEDMFSIGFLAKLLKWAVAPIPFKKSTNDVGAVMNCMRIAHDGGTICVFPEGNRTYHGRTVNMKDSIATMAKKMRLPIAFFRIENGYGVQPRWSNVKRKGRMKAGITRIMEPEEFSSLSEQELYEIIKKELFVDEHTLQGEFRSKRLAEYIERAFYVCPDCGLSNFSSSCCRITCTRCGKQIDYLPDKALKGVGFDFRFKNEGEWYDYQEDFIRKLDLSEYIDTPAYEEKAVFIKVIPYKFKQVISKNAIVRLFGDRYEITFDNETRTLDFADISATTAVGRNKFNIYTREDIFQIKSDEHFNALKYVNFYYAMRNGEDGNAEFLGL